MRTTINVDEHLLADAKRLAADTARTLGQVIEDSLREALGRRRATTAKPVKLPLSRSARPPRPGVDLDDSAGLLDLMEPADRPR